MSHRDLRVTQAAPGDATAWYRLGMALAERGHRGRALLAFRNALLHDATRPHVHRALGSLLFDCGQVEHALQCFDHAAKCDCHLPPA
jgi:Flp pilus assembly protein TadD